ncbi:MAG: ATP-binding protein [Cytophagales bacterium]|nr:ATP-binding protein [Cytophagales bacterium]
MKHRIIIPCEKEKLESVRVFVQGHLDTYGLSEIESHKIVLAIDEVCANMIIHSNNCDPNESLELEMVFKKNQNIIFVIRDKGESFDINAYKEPSMQEIISSKRKGGLGLMLVKRIMDKIEFTTENNYNICRLTKKL